ncbi:MAG: 30S ribosomal protein S4 [Candidatus Hydrogenedentes bacterium]|jgi:small subunit ribosomal protein S4|nr:30S ribosomal protein S4 [Candidatus Hydrogenedentota bacterium]
MAKYCGPKHRLSRRVGKCIWGRPGSPAEKRPYPPGQHGKTLRRKLSVYGIQLLEKQKVRMYYGGIMERQMRRIFAQAKRLDGNTGTNLMILLESRLDTVVWRLGYAPTIFSARQMVNHCHILVDGEKVNIPSFLVKPGMTISIRERSRKIPMIQNGVENPPHELPEYLEREAKSYEGKMISTPNINNFPVEFDTTSIIGFYSR